VLSEQQARIGHAIMGSTAAKPGDTSSPAPPAIDEHPWLERVAAWDDAEADAQIRKGLSVDLAVYLQKTLDLTDADTAHLLGRSRSTYARYRNAGKDLGTAEAERAVRFARLLARAAETFGSVAEAADWMHESNYRLGGARPLEMAETDPGARVVRDLLCGLQHGHPA
jgi:putative toxin-antitoxin system antitoxin component (TIGR02293 family)